MSSEIRLRSPSYIIAMNNNSGGDPGRDSGIVRSPLCPSSPPPLSIENVDSSRVQRVEPVLPTSFTPVEFGADNTRDRSVDRSIRSINSVWNATYSGGESSGVQAADPRSAVVNPVYQRVEIDEALEEPAEEPVYGDFGLLVRRMAHDYEYVPRNVHVRPASAILPSAREPLPECEEPERARSAGPRYSEGRWIAWEKGSEKVKKEDDDENYETIPPFELEPKISIPGTVQEDEDSFDHTNKGFVLFRRVSQASNNENLLIPRVSSRSRSPSPVLGRLLGGRSRGSTNRVQESYEYLRARGNSRKTSKG